MQSKSKSLHYYIRLIMWTTAIVPVLIYSIYLARLEVKHYQNEVKLYSQQTVNSLELFLSNFDDEIRNSLNMFTGNYALQMVKENPNYGPVVNSSIAQFNQGRVYKDIAFGLSDGRMFTENINILPKDYDPRMRPWYKIAVEHPGEIKVTDLYQDALDPLKWTITYSKAVYSDISNQLIGVAGADVTLTKLGLLFEQNHINEAFRLLILDNNHRIIASSDMNGVLRMSDGSMLPENYRNQKLIRYEEDQYFLETQNIGFMNWEVVLLSKRSDVYLSVLKTLLPVFLLASVFILLVSMVSESLEPKILKALDQIVDSLKRMGTGDYLTEDVVLSTAPLEFVIIQKEVGSMKKLIGDQTNKLMLQKNEINEQYQEINALYEETAAMNESLNDLLEQIEHNYGLTVEALSNAIEANDFYTKGHCERVRLYSLKMGEAIGLGPNQLKDLEYASILHDIGKVGIPSSILNKQSPLSSEEYDQIKMHPELGAKIISNVPYLSRSAEIIKHHHEWYNGTGYPDGLKGNETNIMSQIIGVADAYDAMTSIRSYRKVPLTHEMAVEQLILGKETQFNPELVTLMITLFNLNSF